jgi:hypothetical protein
MAERFVVLGLGHVEVFAAEPVPEALAPDGAPELAGLFAVEGEKLGHGVNAFGVEALFCLGADAGQVAEGELGEGFRQDVEGEGDEAVGLLHVAGDFGEVAVGGEADGTSQHWPDALADSCLDLAA